MRQLAMKSVVCLLHGTFALGSLAGCGDDGGGEGTTSSSSGGSTTTTSTTSSDPTTESTSDSTSDTTTTTTTGPTSTSDPTTDGTGTTTTGAGRACVDEINFLRPMVTDNDGGCTVVVRLNFENLDILGWTAQCGATDGPPVDEVGARALTDCCGQTGNRLNPIEDETFFVFSIDPADDGDIAVVTNHLQARAFEGTVIYNGDGAIGFPTSFEEASILEADCAPTDIPKTVTYDILNGGLPIDQDDVAEVLDVIRNSPLPAAMNENAEVLRAAIILYPPSVPFVPGDGEYIAIIEGGPPA